jgi:DNA replication and repair protein RecF
MKINKLKLNNFRNHGHFELDVESNIIAITGKNGMGKTNILEAVSLLSASKGLRKAKLTDLQKQGVDRVTPWSIYAEIESDDDVTKIGVGFDTEKFLENGKEKKIIKINGEKQRGQNSLAEYTCITWLTPAHDLTFQSGTLSRDFLDNICELFFPDYASQLAIYNNAKSQRRRLLAQNKYDDIWLASLETQMAQKALAISYSRLEVIERINSAMALTAHSTFPAALVEIEGELENILKSKKAVEAENEYLFLLKTSRQHDAYTGKTSHGPHRTKLKVTHLDKNQIAEFCSTGEQKAMLLSITLASCVAKKNFSSIAPIVLLDEIIAHLDSEKRTKLLQFLVDINAQVWASGVDSSDFSVLGGKVQNISL